MKYLLLLGALASSLSVFAEETAPKTQTIDAAALEAAVEKKLKKNSTAAE